MMVGIDDILKTLVARRELSEPQIRSILTEILCGRLPEPEAAAVLVGMRVKGETAGELAAAAQVLREHMTPLPTERDDVLDTCGTGGDGSGTFNISTATALVVAAAGVPVVKHGNRSVSSRTGSADVLTALGVRIDGDPDYARRSLQEAGFAFCFAPTFHPALRHVSGLRRRLGVPTIFNCLGPLANPARARHQLLGVGRPELLDLMAGALARLGTTHAILVCGDDGLDEVSLSAPTQVRHVRGHDIEAETWTAADLGLPACRLQDLAAADVPESARLIRQVLAGHDGPPRDVVLANGAAALLAADCAHDLKEGVDLARRALESGRARQVLEILQGLGAPRPREKEGANG